MGVLGPQGCVTRGAQDFGVLNPRGACLGVHGTLGCSRLWGAQPKACTGFWGAQCFEGAQCLGLYGTLGCSKIRGAQPKGCMPWGAQRFGAHNVLGCTARWGAQHFGVHGALWCGMQTPWGTPALGCTAFRGAPHLKAQLFGAQCTLGGLHSALGGCTTFWGARCLGLWRILGCT